MVVVEEDGEVEDSTWESGGGETEVAGSRDAKAGGAVAVVERGAAAEEESLLSEEEEETAADAATDSNTGVGISELSTATSSAVVARMIGEGEEGEVVVREVVAMAMSPTVGFWPRLTFMHDTKGAGTAAEEEVAAN